MELVIFYLLLVIVVGIIANSRKRSAIGWAVLALIISPLFAGILVVVLPTKSSAGAPDFEQAIRNSSIRQQYAPYIRRHKPALSWDVVYDVNVNGEKRRFSTEADALAFVANRLGHQQPAAPQQTTQQIAAPGPQFETYKGIRYVTQVDHTITAHTPAGLEAFPSLFAFRAWADGLASNA